MPPVVERSTCDLVRQFGDRYRRYREQVGMLVPRIGSRRTAAGDEATPTGR